MNPKEHFEAIDIVKEMLKEKERAIAEAMVTRNEDMWIAYYNESKVLREVIIALGGKF